MSHRPIAHSPDLARLLAEGYAIAIRSGYLVVRDIPYVNAERQVCRGSLIMPLALANNVTAPPADHTTYFEGEYPCDAEGQPITAIKNNSNAVTLAPGLNAQHYFSAKPQPKGNYDDFHHKVTSYAAILSGPAQRLDSSVRPNAGRFVASSDEDDSVFHYLDTASPRVEISAITAKLERRKVVIIGLGGTGGYILDQVAKTPVAEIHLYDGDIFEQHNAFRAPGAASGAELEKSLAKVEYFKAKYEVMRKGIVAHQRYVNETNIAEILDADFVFICIDDGKAKAVILRALEEAERSFIDAGMGIYRHETSLGGIVRTTTSSPEMRDHIWSRKRISFAKQDDDNIYERNIQVAELNALNAIMAVIKWKKLWGFYVDLGGEHHSSYTIDTNALLNEDSE